VGKIGLATDQELRDAARRVFSAYTLDAIIGKGWAEADANAIAVLRLLCAGVAVRAADAIAEALEEAK
jgi:hypothetical protein